MTDTEKIRTRFEVGARALAISPAAGKGTAVTKVRMRDGLTCEVTEGPWRLTVDMAEKHGGNGRGPNPGFLGRGALGSCLAMSIRMWAARRGVKVSALEVEVQADYDSRGSYGVGEAPAGYSEVRYVVRIASPAPESEVTAMLDEAEKHTSYLELFGRGCRLRRVLEIGKEG